MNEAFNAPRIACVLVNSRSPPPWKNTTIAMKYHGLAESQRLEGFLEDALAKEKRHWKVPVFRNGQIVGTDISQVQYQEVILWLGKLSKLFRFYPETYALGVCILNRLLASVKAQPKYLRCIAITSMILAAKVGEEDEAITSVKDLAVRGGCNFSTAEILRMERIILDKLRWDLYTATAVDFVHIFHALVMSAHPHLAQRCSQKMPFLQVALWTRQVQHCMACHQLSQFRGSTLALAIITLELERLTPDWVSVFKDLLRKAQVASAELICCREMVDEFFDSLDLTFPPNTVYILHAGSIGDGRAAPQDLDSCKPRAWGEGRPTRWTRRVKANSGGGVEDEEEEGADEFYDGFRCLYNEEMVVEVGDDGTSGRGEAYPRGGTSPCPPLQAPVN